MRAAIFTACPRMLSLASTPPPSSTAAGMDAHAHVEAIVPMLAAHELALLPSGGEERQAGADRALGIVLRASTAPNTASSASPA